MLSTVYPDSYRKNDESAVENFSTNKSTYILYKITSFLSLWWSMRHNLGEAFLSHPLLNQVFSTLSCRGVEKWHLFSLRAQRPKIKLLELGPLCCIYRNQLEDKWRDSYSTGCHKRPCTHTTVHTRLYSDAPLLYMQARYTQMYVHSACKKASLHGWIKQTFCWRKHQGIDFYLWLENSWHNLKGRADPRSVL